MRFERFPTWPQWERASTSFMEKLTAKPSLAQFNPTFARANKAKILAIDDMVMRYHKVLDMSKLNLLMQIREAIIDWASDKIDRDASSGRLAAMRALLDVTLRTIAELDQWGRHRYVKAACIGYQIETGAYEKDWSPKNAARRRKLDDADVATSCADLVMAIEKAQTAYQHYVNNNGIQLDDDRKTLKIFMAPEFFFRGRYGAYQDVGLCAKIMELMRNEIRDAKYADWLFVHGSALFTTQRDPTQGGGSYLENYALVQKGGAPNKTSDLIVAKEFPSHVDFEHPTVDDDQWYDPAVSEARIAGQDVKHISPARPRHTRPRPVRRGAGVRVGRRRAVHHGQHHVRARGLPRPPDRPPRTLQRVRQGADPVDPLVRRRYLRGQSRLQDGRDHFQRRRRHAACQSAGAQSVAQQAADEGRDREARRREDQDLLVRRHSVAGAGAARRGAAS